MPDRREFLSVISGLWCAEMLTSLEAVGRTPGEELPTLRKVAALGRGRADDESSQTSEDSWQLAQEWLRVQYPGFQILAASRRPDLARSLSGTFLRILFMAGGRKRVALIADRSGVNDSARSALTQALLFLIAEGGRHGLRQAPEICVVVPSRHAAREYEER